MNGSPSLALRLGVLGYMQYYGIAIKDVLTVIGDHGRLLHVASTGLGRQPPCSLDGSRGRQEFNPRILHGLEHQHHWWEIRRERGRERKRARAIFCSESLMLMPFVSRNPGTQNTLLEPVHPASVRRRSKMGSQLDRLIHSSRKSHARRMRASARGCTVSVSVT